MRAAAKLPSLRALPFIPSLAQGALSVWAASECMLSVCLTPCFKSPWQLSVPCYMQVGAMLVDIHTSDSQAPMDAQVRCHFCKACAPPVEQAMLCALP